MTQRWFVPILLLLLALLACGPSGPSQNAIQTAIAQTQVIQATATSGAAQTMTAGAPTPTRSRSANLPPTPTPTPAVTEVPSRTPAPTHTPAPAHTAEPGATFTPLALASPSPTKTATSKPKTTAAVKPPLDFLGTVANVKKQVENFGGQIDIAVNSGSIDCQQIVDSYEFVAARSTLNNVPASLAGAYGLYSQGVSLFLTKAADLYQNCKNFLADPNGGGGVPAQQWTVARTAVNDAGDLLRQAIIAAGGTP